MASLTLQVGSFSESVSMPDAAALTLLENYLQTLDTDASTNEEKARAVLLSLAEHMRQQAARGIHEDERQQLQNRAASRIDEMDEWGE